MTLDISAILLAIAIVESGCDDEAIGKNGELSRYQITRNVWRQHCSAMSFDRFARFHEHSRKVAVSHLDWIRRQLPLHSVKPYQLSADPYRIALCWRYGVKGADKIRHTKNDYACRVTALYWDLVKNPIAESGNRIAAGSNRHKTK